MIETRGLIEAISEDLQRRIEPGYPEIVRERYGINPEQYWGVRTPDIREVATSHWPRVKGLDVDDRLDLCTRLIETGVFEHKIIAFQWAHQSRREYAERHFCVLAGWLASYVDDWSDCDDLSSHVLGEFLLRFPAYASEVVGWTASRNRWLRRGAAVSLIPLVRKGKLLDLAFSVADRLLSDQDDLVQKGYGWMLKEATKAHPREVFEYVVKNRATMPRTALRYAIEKLDPDLRRQAMER